MQKITPQYPNSSNDGKLNYLEVNYSHKKIATPYDFDLIKYLLSITGVCNKKVLDLACGTGSFKSVFDSFGFEYTGVDIDNSDPMNNIHRCDIGNAPLPFKNECFDLIFFKMGIEHLNLKEIANCLAECYRVLNNGGKLIVITPDWKWSYRTFYEEYTHQTPFTSLSLSSALKMANFECLYCKNFIQLPIIWKYPALKIVSKLASFLYPITKKKYKFIKFSQERPLLAIGIKLITPITHKTSFI